MAFNSVLFPLFKKVTVSSCATSCCSRFSFQCLLTGPSYPAPLRPQIQCLLIAPSRLLTPCTVLATLWFGFLFCDFYKLRAVTVDLLLSPAFCWHFMSVLIPVFTVEPSELSGGIPLFQMRKHT